MTRRRKWAAGLLAVPLIAGAAVVVTNSAFAEPELSGDAIEYSVLAGSGADVAAAERAVRDAGGKVERSNAAVGLITATAPENGFAERLADASAVQFVSPTVTIGQSPQAKRVLDNTDIEQENRHNRPSPSPAKAKVAGPELDPLDDQLWGLSAARADLARDKQTGDKRVKVGVLDTGVDGSHPDIAPNFDSRLSRNFTRDIPTDEHGQEVDGPCEFRGCVDPADWDDSGHGTHVAGTIAAAADGFGISGVAPDVSIVNIRGGQDSGYFFLQPVVDALTYAGDAGLDVVNMSFYVDPWLYNCSNHPADTPEQQEQQRTAVAAVSRALDYAHDNGVTLVSALGNQHTNIGAPKPDTGSPNYPAGNPHTREIDNDTCLTLPAEGPHVINVGSYGPSQAKSAFSTYGMERISVSAPGGWYRDYFGTPWFQTNENMILSAYARNVALANGDIDEDGNVTPGGKELGVQKACTDDGTCGYYRFSQGTSMASPHAAGVAALIVSEYGKPTGSRKKAAMAPDSVRSVLEGTAFAIPCPEPRTVDYIDEGRPEDWTATCAGDLEFNGFYGHGSIDAYAAVTRGDEYL